MHTKFSFTFHDTSESGAPLRRAVLEIKVKATEREQTSAVDLSTVPPGAPTFSMSGSVRTPNGRGWYCGGQIQDNIGDLFKTTKLYNLWGRWHLNDLKAGTVAQMLCVSALSGHPNWYTAACEHLKANNLDVVEHGEKSYTFGHAWLLEPLPADFEHQLAEAIEEIKTLYPSFKQL